MGEVLAIVAVSMVPQMAPVTSASICCEVDPGMNGAGLLTEVCKNTTSFRSRVDEIVIALIYSEGCDIEME